MNNNQDDESAIFNLAVVMRRNKKKRNYVLLVSGLTFIVTALILSIGWKLLVRYFVIGIFIFMLSILSGLILLSSLLSFLPFYEETNQELSELKEERVKIKEKLSKVNKDKNKEDVFDIIQLNQNQLTEYYTINKDQAKKSFSISVLSIGIGLFIIVMTVFLSLLRKDISKEVSYISGISGILLEFIGGTFLFIYKNSVRQTNYYYNELINVQNTMLAYKICCTIDNSRNLELKEKIIINLLNRSKTILPNENENVIEPKHAIEAKVD